MAGPTAEVEGMEINPRGVEELLRDPKIVEELIAAAAIITGVAITYSGKFTGELNASMQYKIVEADDGTMEAHLGSGTRDGKTVAQASLNWYGHYDPDGLKVDPDYPEWKTHPGVKTQPSQPYEHALKELNIPFEVAQDFIAYDPNAGPFE